MAILAIRTLRLRGRQVAFLQLLLERMYRARPNRSSLVEKVIVMNARQMRRISKSTRNACMGSCWVGPPAAMHLGTVI